MINKNDELSFITGEDGKEKPIQVFEEFEREENGKRFVIYTDIEDIEFEDREFFVAEIIKNSDGSEELVEITSEEDMEYCQEVFDSMVDRILSANLSDDEDESQDDDLDDEETLVS